ncbi:HEXA_B [Lepeophtheirus salmonis]|uniref:Beta-hexosaminidase n=1 Tax=Lepeophtheirus salmonis TaxID=72036 RepID=A0A7R8HDX8_LEPSM|nr:HEXA_B [Lepeophtheirus salmonis]CAF3037957.1 HEXA_B [Lepeophtheirus salmonis]
MTIKVESLTTYQCKCKMTCNPNGLLWPLPTGSFDLSQDVTRLYPNDVTFHLESQVPTAPGKLIAQAQNIFKFYLQALHPDYDVNENPKPFKDQKSKTKLDVRISVISPSIDITLKTDESYSLNVTSTKDREYIAYINAETYFGARHGLETLSQLFGYDEMRDSLLLHSKVTIYDEPMYVHRGILVDTSRNFMSLKSLRSVIDGMSYNKLNIFHWHITDTHSFPFVSESVPELSEYGAYSSRKTYTKKEIKEFVEYARIRGVKVLPEFDAPAHVGHGWEFGKKATVWPTQSQLMKRYVFHMGGDEINLNCWNATTEISNWLENQGLNATETDLIGLWIMFQKKAQQLVYNANKKRETTLDTFGLVTADTQVGLEKAIIGALLIKDGNLFTTIVPEEFIEVRWNMMNKKENNILGGEACMWSEQVDEFALPTKLWPRGAALGERLWSDPDSNWKKAETRMLHNRFRMVARGIQASALQPQWCHQHEGHCKLNGEIEE